MVGSGEHRPAYDAAMAYRRAGVPLVVIAGAEYGTGSSRDWAAKGTRLLGVRAVIAESFERIHRSNLIGLGVLPLQFTAGASRHTLALDGSELLHLRGLDALTPGKPMELVIQRASGERLTCSLRCRIDTANEVSYFESGGILHHVLAQLAAS